MRRPLPIYEKRIAVFVRTLSFSGLLSLTFLLFPFLANAQAPWYDPCTNPYWVSTGPTCNNTGATMWNATQTAGIGVYCGTTGNAVDVWFAFTAKSTNPVITISSMGARMDDFPRLQLFSGACGSLISLGCINNNNTTTLTLNATGLTIGTNYLVRVYSGYTAATAGVAADWNFNFCITDPPPANDNCAGAVLLTAGINCTNTAGNMYSSTASPEPVAPCGGPVTYDVWYRFVAISPYNTVSLNSVNGNFQNPRLQLFSGGCAGLTSVACGTTTVVATPPGLTVGNTYYVRVYSAGGAIPNNSAGFNICVTTPVQANIEFSKSYVNITKSNGGGTVVPGDTLEIRATLVVQSQTIDSVAYNDTLFRSAGLRLVPGSISLRTNEGKIYSQYTDAVDADAGWRVSFGAGPDTAIRINMGIGASGVAKGKIRNTSKPNFYNACIIMATYRVVVYAPYDTKINFGGGAFSFRDTAVYTNRSVPFKRDSIMVYQSPGLCPNAVSAINAIGVEWNGTFGAPAGSAPLIRNRASSTYVPNYIYNPFGPNNGPNDYYYSIVNNSSTRYTTSTTWGKIDSNSPSYRLFGRWDITGDHTGATDPLRGNPPCDTTQPVSPTNPCGYMLIINSSYKTDTAFQYTVTNLCPNTFYEISAWIKNMCYYCGSDSNGNLVDNPAYIPSAPGDSSGVQPNIAFEINGTDYFTTGNIRYVGVSPRGSDSTNRWVKKGFIFKTGVTETSFVLGIRNSAPGGGGNDWVIDDIAVSTCLPNMRYSPSNNPMVCRLNPLTIYDTVRSYFDNYIYYKWQRSTDNGATWSDETGALGPAAPVWNGSAWQYITSYTIPHIHADTTNTGDMYRLVVATTPGNLSDPNCLFTDGVSVIRLQVNDCGTPLKTDLLSFNGRLVNGYAHLSWTTSQEKTPLRFIIERSADGTGFVQAGTVNSFGNYNAETNAYSFIDSSAFAGKAYYRIVVTENGDKKKYSRTIRLTNGVPEFDLQNVVNPFVNELLFDVTSPAKMMIEISLSDILGRPLVKTTSIVYTGANGLRLDVPTSLPAGIYLLRVKNKDKLITRQVIKK